VHGASTAGQTLSFWIAAIMFTRNGSAWRKKCGLYVGAKSGQGLVHGPKDRWETQRLERIPAYLWEIRRCGVIGTGRAEPKVGLRRGKNQREVRRTPFAQITGVGFQARKQPVVFGVKPGQQVQEILQRVEKAGVSGEIERRGKIREAIRDSAPPAILNSP
jgi:hypothetical protein